MIENILADEVKKENSKTGIEVRERLERWYSVKRGSESGSYHPCPMEQNL